MIFVYFLRRQEGSKGVDTQIDTTCIKCDNNVKLLQNVAIRTTFYTDYFWNK